MTTSCSTATARRPTTKCFRLISTKRFYLALCLLYLGGTAWTAVHILGKAAGLCPFPVCLFKCVTGYACPGCGSTRGLVAMFHGNVAEAFFHCNALSVIEAPVLVVLPLLLLADAVSGKARLYRFWLHTERWLKRPAVVLPVVGLVLANWIWNLFKGL